MTAVALMGRERVAVDENYAKKRSTLTKTHRRTQLARGTSRAWTSKER